jgi:hypothetical protein
MHSLCHGLRFAVLLLQQRLHLRLHLRLLLQQLLRLHLHPH